MFPIVQRTIRERERLLDLLAEVEIGRVHVSIGTQLQDEAMSALVKPVVLAELKGRIASFERDLESYGVAVGDVPERKGTSR